MFFTTFCATGLKRKDWSAASRLGSAYRFFLETIVQQLLEAALGLQPTSAVRTIKPEDIAVAIEQKFSEKIKKNPEWSKVRDHPLRVASYFYPDIVGERTRLSTYRKHLTKLMHLRNRSGPHPSDGEFEDFIDLRASDWESKFAAIEEAMSQMCEAILDVDYERTRLGQANAEG